LEIGLEAGTAHHRFDAEIPPGLTGRRYLRFRFVNADAEPEYRGPLIDNLEVRCVTRHPRYGKAYGVRHGTSFAAPLVSGVAALYMWRYPQASKHVQCVKRALRKGANRERLVQRSRERLKWRGTLDALHTLKSSPSASRCRQASATR
jgi:hypothetical protein